MQRTHAFARRHRTVAIHCTTTRRFAFGAIALHDFLHDGGAVDLAATGRRGRDRSRSYHIGRQPCRPTRGSHQEYS